MVRSKNVIGTISFAAMLLSLVVIGSGIWLALQAKNSCIKILHWPVIIIGILFFLVALAGVIGGFRRIQPFIVFFYFGMIIVIILLVILVVFICVTTERKPGMIVPNRSYKERSLSEFSYFFRQLTNSASKWHSITNCVISTSMCAELNQTYSSRQDFDAHVTQFQSGCCSVPMQCNFTYENPTYWIKPKPWYVDRLVEDCERWTNNQEQLCYACDSCRAGLLQDLTSEWRRANLILTVTLVALIFVYLMGCFALKNSKIEDIFRN